MDLHRRADGSAGDADYGRIGGAYSRYRRPEPRIAEFVHRALGGARTVLNVGAGAGSYEPADRLTAALGGGAVTVHQVPIPLDCVDGFNEAYYGRPEALLDPDARLSCSAWSFVGPDVVDRFTTDLRRDLDDGTWDARHGHLRTQPTFDGSLILVIDQP